MRYRSATVADSHGLPLISSDAKNKNGPEAWRFSFTMQENFHINASEYIDMKSCLLGDDHSS